MFDVLIQEGAIVTKRGVYQPGRHTFFTSKGLHHRNRNPLMSNFGGHTTTSPKCNRRKRTASGVDTVMGDRGTNGFSRHKQGDRNRSPDGAGRSNDPYMTTNHTTSIDLAKFQTLWENALGEPPAREQFVIWAELHSAVIIRQAILKTAMKNQSLKGAMDLDHRLRYASKVMQTLTERVAEHAVNQEKLRQEFGSRGVAVIAGQGAA